MNNRDPVRFVSFAGKEYGIGRESIRRRNEFIADLKPLTRLTKLRWLDLSHSEPRSLDLSEFLAHLTDEEAVRWDSLLESGMSEDRVYSIIFLEPLSHLIDLKELNLENSHVSDLEPVRRLTNLQYVVLKNTPVNDLGPLAKFWALTRLDLQNTRVASLAPLGKLWKLRELDLRGTCVPDLEMDEFENSHPYVSIRRW